MPRRPLHLPPATAPLHARTEALAGLGSWIMDLETGNIHFSEEACRLCGLSSPDHASRDVLYRQMRASDRLRIETAWRSAMTGAAYEVEFRLCGEDRPAWLWEKAEIEFDAEGHAVRAIGILQDITHRRRTEEEIVNRANYDHLTGLPNRNLLSEHLNLALRLAKRNQMKMAVLFIDLDRFKHVNDTLGHSLGDMLLQEVARRMKDCLRESDMVARQGGDEFMVVLQDVEHDAYAGLVALKIIEEITRPFDLAGKEAFVGASIGISLYPEDGQDADILFRNADMAMYRAKESGRETLCFFDPAMTQLAIQRQHMESDLRRAVERQEFVLHYQPIADIQSRELVGVEALIRWMHPHQGVIGPDVFIPTAEEVGLVRDIGRWVITEVCRQIAVWRADGLDFYVSVNVSGRQIPEGLPLDWIEHALAVNRIPPELLVFEITESTLLRDTPKTQKWLESVRHLGIKLSLDDFGMGYASLGYLRRIHIDTMKIDKSFVMTMLEEPRQLALVKAIIGIARNLDMGIVAEGIENAQVMTRLDELGCDYAQGYYLSRPVTAEQVSQRVHQCTDLSTAWAD